MDDFLEVAGFGVSEVLMVNDDGTWSLVYLGFDTIEGRKVEFVMPYEQAVHLVEFLSERINDFDNNLLKKNNNNTA